jgi:hypothetical protein
MWKLGEMRKGRPLQPLVSGACCHLGFKPLFSRTVRCEFLLFKPPGLWQFVKAVLESGGVCAVWSSCVLCMCGTCGMGVVCV